MHTDASIVIVNDIFADGQAKAQPFLVDIIGPLDLAELPKELLLLIRVKPIASVGHLHLDELILHVVPSP